MVPADTRLTAKLETSFSARSRSLAGRFRWALTVVRSRGAVTGSATLGRGSAIRLLGGRLKAGKGLVIDRASTVSVQGALVIGNDVYVGPGSNIACSLAIQIGDQVRIAEGVSIHDANHLFEPVGDPGRLDQMLASRVEVGARTWIASRVVVLPGVHIGQDCVIGAGSVVTADIPDRTIAVGSPARVVRSLTAVKRATGDCV